MGGYALFRRVFYSTNLRILVALSACLGWLQYVWYFVVCPDRKSIHVSCIISPYILQSICRYTPTNRRHGHTMYTITGKDSTIMADGLYGHRVARFWTRGVVSCCRKSKTSVSGPNVLQKRPIPRTTLPGIQYIRGWGLLEGNSLFCVTILTSFRHVGSVIFHSNLLFFPTIQQA